MVADIHYWRGNTYSDYLKGNASWKNACPDYKISKEAVNSEFYKESQKWHRQDCF